MVRLFIGQIRKLLVVAISLGVVVALVVWCVLLGMSVEQQRKSLLRDNRALIAIGQAEAALEESEALLLDARQSAFHRSSEAALQSMQSAMAEFQATCKTGYGRGYGKTLKNMEQHLQDVFNQGRAILTAQGEGVNAYDAYKFQLSCAEVRARIRALVAEIHEDQTAITDQLWTQWQKLFVVALILILLVIGLAIALVLRQRVFTKQHQQQQHYLRQVIDLNPNFIFSRDREGRYCLVNQAVADAYKTTVENLIGKSDAEFNLNMEQVQCFLRDDRHVMETGEELFISQESATDGQGRRLLLQTVKRPIFNEQGDVREVLGVSVDITDLKRAEQLTHWRNQVLERLAAGAPLKEVLDTLVRSCEQVDTSVCGMVFLLTANKKHLELASAPHVPEHICTYIESVVYPLDASLSPMATVVCNNERLLLPEFRGTAEAFACEHFLYSEGFRSGWAEPIRNHKGEVLGVIGFYSRQKRVPEKGDLEILESAAQIAAIAIERKEAESALQQSQLRLQAADRLASIGTLTAGFGHDVNNLLFPLRCRLEAINWEKLEPAARDILLSTRDTIDYLQKLSDTLRLLSADRDQSESLHAKTNLYVWWEELSPLLEEVTLEQQGCVYELAEGLPEVQVESSRLTQAVLNLVMNAVEASSEGSPIRVIMKRSEIDVHHVEISVIDYGQGMDEEVRKRVFDPFFTTKSRSISTGLGLSLVYGIAQSAGGDVDIDSVPGQGTIVTLRLPGVEEQWEQRKQPRAVVEMNDARTAGWISSMLSSQGYIIEKAGDGLPMVDVLVTKPLDENLERVKQYVHLNGQVQIILLGEASAQWQAFGSLVIKDPEDLASIRAIIQETVRR